MGATASQITSVSIVYSTVSSGVDQGKHQSSALQAFVRGIDRWPVNSPTKGQLRGKCFHCLTPKQNISVCVHICNESVFNMIRSQLFAYTEHGNSQGNDSHKIKSWGPSQYIDVVSMYVSWPSFPHNGEPCTWKSILYTKMGPCIRETSFEYMIPLPGTTTFN